MTDDNTGVHCHPAEMEPYCMRQPLHFYPAEWEGALLCTSLSRVSKGEGEGFWKCFPHPVRGSEGRGLASVENVKPLWGKIAFANLSYANKIWFALNAKRKIVLKRKKKNVMGRTRGLLKVSYSINFPYTSVWTFVKCKCAQRREQ